ncbi:ATP-grasp domain-containing protein [Streptomyces sp. NPDC001941]|uniref:ATP-grasp domain-containing protein n=1 Tax=Streptomyces sp. NPDC001941 TaxID=3154659 RepID=UPI003331C9E7
MSSGTLYAPILAEAGIPVVLLDTGRALAAGLRDGSTPGALDFELDFGGDRERLLAHCVAQGVGYVIAGTESGIELVEYLRESIPGCPANSAGGSRKRWDKEAMFSALHENGVPSLRTRAIAPGTELSEDLLARHGASLPAVVKPSTGAGSVGVRMVKDTGELREAVESILGAPGFFGDRPSALVQELFPAPQTEYVVDTSSHDGVHEVLGLSRYDKRLSAQGDFVYERIQWMSPEETPAREIIRYAEEVLRAFGVRVGPSHMEIMYNARTGPRLIDFGARAHGAGHPLKTYKLTGVSQIHRECEYVAHLLRGTALSAAGGSYALPRDGAIIFFSLDEATRCAAQPDEEALRELPGVHEVMVNAVAGRDYPATRSLLDSLDLGLVFLSARDAKQLDEYGGAVREKFASYFA